MLASFPKVRKTYHPKARKSTFSITPLLFDAPLQGTLANIRRNLILPGSRVIELHLSRWQHGSIFIQILVVGSERRMSFETVRNSPSRSSKVIDFGTNRQRVCDFLLVINSNLGPILLRFRDIAGFLLRRAIPPLFHPNFGVVPLRLDCRCCGSEQRKS